jgi:hypothetical protein
LEAEKLEFETVYRVMRKRTANRMARNLSPIWISFKTIIQAKEGSKKEIELRAALNKLRFILLNKKRLRQEFENICLVLYRIKEQNLTKAEFLKQQKKDVLINGAR